jgi:hypothetical protein
MRLIKSFLLVLLSMALLSCGSELKTGSGHWVTQTRSVAPFDRVSLNGHFKLNYADHQQPGITVSADDNLLPFIHTVVKNGELTINVDPNVRLNASNVITVHLASRHLQSITSSGSNEIQLSGLQEPWFRVKSQGGDHIELQGDVKEVLYDCSGIAYVDATELKAEDVSVTLKGAGEVTVAADQKLNVNLSGVAKVRYLGSPKIDSHLSGRATLSHA